MKKHYLEQVQKSFESKGDMARYISKEKETLLKIKRAEYKQSKPELLGDFTFKGIEPKIDNITGDVIEIKAVINTTNIIDSHLDLHMPKTWNKTVADNPTSVQLNSHRQDFENLLSNSAKQYNQEFSFKDLGLDSEMKTTANINQFILNRKTNPLMFDRYVSGMVKEHSVGMYYVKISLAYYDEESQKEMDYFHEKLKFAINPEIAKEQGMFWVVEEAKKSEGSAVVFGSNSITPTLWVKNYEPTKNTQKNEPLIITPNKEPLIIDTLEAIKMFNKLKV